MNIYTYIYTINIYINVIYTYLRKSEWKAMMNKEMVEFFGCLQPSPKKEMKVTLDNKLILVININH